MQHVDFCHEAVCFGKKLDKLFPLVSSIACRRESTPSYSQKKPKKLMYFLKVWAPVGLTVLCGTIGPGQSQPAYLFLETLFQI